MNTNYRLLNPDYRHGYEAAGEDLLDPRYDLGEALASFRRDPPDSASQEGYLRRLQDESERRLQAIADKYEQEQRAKYFEDCLLAIRLGGCDGLTPRSWRKMLNFKL